MNLDFSNTKLRLSRSILSYAKVQNMVAFAIRNKSILFRKPRDGAYIDVGSGWNTNNDFYHIDYGWHPGIDLCWDITRGLPFDDDSIGGIFSEHCAEHIEFEQFLELAREFKRVLRTGATLRIIVPDGELYATRYLKREDMPYSEGDGFGFYTPFMSVNRIFYESGHKFIFDFDTLSAALKYVGFRAIEKCSFRVGRDPKLLIDSQERAIESLYVEAEK